MVNIQFMRKMQVSKVCIYLDYGLDESYTPKRLGFRCGTSLHDLVDICSVELNEPAGWLTVPLTDPLIGSGSACRTHLLQIRVHQMHQNGRDTHIRQIKVFGHRSSGVPIPKFTTIGMLQHMSIR